MNTQDLSDEYLENLSWEELLELRRNAQTQAEQNKLANAEHQAYARDTVKENPLMALPMAAMVPGYQVFKGIAGGARSEGGLAQMGAGYKGILQGLLEKMTQ